MQISLQFHEYFLTKNVKIVISRRFEIFDIIVRISTCQKKIQKSILRHTKVYLAASQGLPAMRATRAKEAKILSMTFFSECRKANDGLCRAPRRFNFQSFPCSALLLTSVYSGTFPFSPPVEWRPFFTKFPFASFALSTPWRKSSLACWDTPDEKLMSNVIVLKKLPDFDSAKRL